MADVRDEHGNPIQLTDQHGNPVQLTDEYGNPMHLTGVATSPTARSETAAEVAAKVAEDLSREQPHVVPVLARDQRKPTAAGVLGSGPAAVPPREQQKPVVHPAAGVPTTQTAGSRALGTGAALKHNPLPAQEQVRRSGSSSSSSSSEDDGEGGRRKKKGSLKEKLKGAFGGAHKDKAAGAEAAHAHTTTATHSVPAIGTTTVHSKTSTTVPLEHEKKGFMEKIKEKLPGHHHGTN